MSAPTHFVLSKPINAAHKQDQNRLKHFFKYQWLAIALAIFIFILCVMPTVDQNISLNLNDKVLHLMAFSALSFAVGRGLIRGYEKISVTLWLLAIAIPWLWGGIIELVQANFIPSRYGDWLDFFADGVGVLLGLIILFLARKTPLKRWI